MSDHVLTLVEAIMNEQFAHEYKEETRAAIFRAISLLSEYGCPIEAIDDCITQLIRSLRNEYGD